ncbi:hypothetical protein EV359DRAFT_85377 [Lentinula novae-zelandiae]|nr:hypothetical protein EV359DRAFT_85377 [Lentinula novae-zelandiae]
MPYPEEWEARDRLVAGAIVSNIIDPIGLGVDETKQASKIWLSLIKHFEKCDEQRIHLADTGLQHGVFDPTTDTMESHEKKMQNLLKKVHDLGGTTTDAQFRQIVIFSMPPEWRQCVRTVPGSTSADVFTYLETLWYQREEERKEEERDTKRVKALMAVHTQLSSPNQPRERQGGKSTIISHNCNKAGHIAKKWANANAAATDESEATPPVTSPMATYVMSVKATNGE